MISGMSDIVQWMHSLRLRESQVGGLASSRSRSKLRRASFEVLEGRITPTTFLVVNALDGPGAGPSGSLRNAISLADQSGGANDIVEITSKVKGSIVLNSGELTIDTSLTVVNRSGGPIAIRQAMPGQRVIDVTSASLASGVTLEGASSRETLTITGGNVATGNGGGILVENPANLLTLKHVVIAGNSAGLASASDTSQNGGAIDTSGRVALIQSTVGTLAMPNQTSGNGGGVWAGAGLSMTGSTVQGNLAGANAGGAYVNAGNASITSGSQILGNAAPSGTAGGLDVLNGNTYVSKSKIDGNTALNVGGINEIKGNVQVVDGSEVNHNSSTATLDVSTGNFGGGGIAEGVGNVMISHSQVSDNHSVGMYSSGIVVGLGSVTVTSGSRVNGNSNNGPGGGIAANFGGTVTVSGGSQVDHNTGSGNGGGIVNFAGPLGGVKILGHSEVSHNTLTNFESLGQAVGVFLEVLASSLGLDVTTATGGTSVDALNAEIAQIIQEVAATEPQGATHGTTGFVVSGGGIGTLLGASITVSGGSHVDGNVSGVQVSGGNPQSVGIGGGLFSGLGSVTIEGSTVSGNIALGSGGGIWNGGDLTVYRSTIAQNSAVLSPGGGLENATSGIATIVQSTLRSNRASAGAGANNRGTLSLLISNVTQNIASNQGGGLKNTGTMTVVHSKVVANSPDNVVTTP